MTCFLLKKLGHLSDEMASKYHSNSDFAGWILERWRKFHFNSAKIVSSYTKLIIDHLFICSARYSLFENKMSDELRMDELYFKINQEF